MDMTDTLPEVHFHMFEFDALVNSELPGRLFATRDDIGCQGSRGRLSRVEADEEDALVRFAAHLERLGESAARRWPRRIIDDLRREGSPQEGTDRREGREEPGEFEVVGVQLGQARSTHKRRGKSVEGSGDSSLGHLVFEVSRSAVEDLSASRRRGAPIVAEMQSLKGGNTNCGRTVAPGFFDSCSFEIDLRDRSRLRDGGWAGRTATMRGSVRRSRVRRAVELA